VLVNAGNFVRTSADDMHALRGEIVAHGLEVVLAECCSTTHASAGSMRGGVEALWFPFPADDECRVSHRAGNDTENAFARRCRPLAMNVNIPVAMTFLPGEIVVVLDPGHDRRPHQTGN